MSSGIDTLLSALEKHVTERADETLLTLLKGGVQTDYSFAEFRENSLCYAQGLNNAISNDADTEGVVFIVLQHCAELYFTFFGTLYTGRIPAFLPFPTPKQDPDLYWSSHRNLFLHVQPKAIISYEQNIPYLKEACSGLDVQILDIADLDISTPYGGPLPAQEASDIAFLQHSSGTTGLKKGVMLSYGKVAAQISSYSAAINLTAKDTIVSWLPLYHDMGLIACMITPVNVGARIISMDAFEWVSRPVSLLQALETYGGNYAWLPNFAFNLIAQTRPRGSHFDLSSVKALIGCSEPNKCETFERFYQTFADCGLKPGSLRTCYAMAETVFAVSQSAGDAHPNPLYIDRQALETDKRIVILPKDDHAATGYLSNGRVIDGLSVRIHTDDGYESGPTSTMAGEIQVTGRFVFDGYYKNPTMTEEAMDASYYRTGDTGFFHDGELYVCGRIKEMLIVNGRNYYANDIEDIVNSLDGIKKGRNVAFSVFQPRTQSEAAVVVVETELTDKDERQKLQATVKATVFSRLELTLQQVVLVEPNWLIKTTSGKISRKENQQRYNQLTKFDT
ncbi:MAG: AMP-binding protein [Asticcacaulis sp.]